MATLSKFRLRVVGEGRHRVTGVLAFVVPQALDLLSASSYTVSISEAITPQPGVMRLHRINQAGDVAAVWENNSHRSNNHPAPDWCNTVIRLGRELGRNITWETPT